MGSNSTQKTQQATTTYSNSFNQSTSFSDVGNVVFGDKAIDAFTGGNDELITLARYALIGVAAVAAVQLFRGKL